MVVFFLVVNGHAAGVVDGWFLAAVGLSFDDEFVGGGDEPVDGGLGEQRVGMMDSHSSAVRFKVTTVEARW
jgi:hypothetical protein